MKTYTELELQKKFEWLTKSEQINVLWSALNIMQQYNGRSRWECVFFAMDFEPVNDNNWTKTSELRTF